MGKGSTRRPSQVPPSVEADNWARTFGGKPQHDLDAQREQGRVNGLVDVPYFSTKHPEQASRIAVLMQTGAQWVGESAGTLAELKDGMRPFDSVAQ